MRRETLLLVLLAPWLPGQASREAPASRPAAPQRHLDLRYAKVEGVPPAAHSLDLYVPPGAQGAPVLLFVHGGGWARGDMRAAGRLPHPEFFCGRGFLYASLNYRLLPAGRHPANVQDVAAAIAWVHDHIAAFGGDPERLHLMGHSAGAHLAALVATDHRHLAAHGKPLSILKGVISNDIQAYDLPRLLETSRARSFFAHVFGVDPALLRDASPIAHVAPDKGIPPFLIFHNTLWGDARGEQAHAFARALRAAGSEAAVVPVPDRTHGQLNQRLGLPGERTTEECLRFLLRPASRPSGGKEETAGARL